MTLHDEHAAAAWLPGQFRALRTYLGMSVRDTADRYSVSVESVRDWDRGKYQPPEGIRADMEDMLDQTTTVVEHLADRAHDTQAPVAIPRTPRDLPWTVEGITVPEPVTLDWWKIVAARVYEDTGIPPVWPRS